MKKKYTAYKCFLFGLKKRQLLLQNKGDKISKAIFSVTFHDKFFNKLHYFVHSIENVRKLN